MKNQELARLTPTKRSGNATVLTLSIALAAGAAHAQLASESFGNNPAENTSINGYQSTTSGYSTGLSGVWSQLNGNGAALKHRSGGNWNNAQANLTAIGSGYSLAKGGYANFLECNSWGLERAQVALATSIDLTVDGTFYMSFVASSGNFDYAAQVGLNNGTSELMWGNGYAGGTQGLTARYGAMSGVNGATLKGASSVSPTMSGGYDPVLYVAQLQELGGNMTISMYAYDLQTTTGLPTSIAAAGTALWSTTLTGVSGTFNNLELELSGQDGYPSISNPALGTTWGDVTGNIVATPEPSSLALAGMGGIMTLMMMFRRRA
jgi:hypothetical protein